MAIVGGLIAYLADKMGSKIGKKITAQFSKHESWAVFLCNFLGEAKH